MILRSIAFAFLVLFAPAMGAVSKRVILAQGEPVSGEPGAPWWFSFSDAYVDKEGGLIAHALADDGPRIVYKSLGGEVATRVAAGQPISVQGGDSSYSFNFPTGHRAVRATSQGRFVMYGRIPEAPSSPSGWNAIVYGDAAGLRLVACLGGLMPGTTEPISAFSGPVRLDPQGNVVFGARSVNDSAARLLRWSPSGVETILPSPTSLPGFVAFDWLVPDSGEIVAIGHATSAGGGTKREVVRMARGGVTVIARSGDAIPGREADAYSYISSLHSCNAAGDVLFAASSKPPFYPSSEVPGLWLARADGSVDLIANTLANIPAVNGAGDVAYSWQGLQFTPAGRQVETIVASPDTRPEFRDLLSRLSLDEGGGMVFQTDGGIWFRAPGADPVSVARPYETIVHKGAEYQITDLRLSSFISGGEDGLPRALNDWGQIAFVATITKISGPGNSIPQTALMLATLPGGGHPEKKPIGNPDTVIFRTGIGTAVRLALTANDVKPTTYVVAIDSVTQGAFGKVSIRDGVAYYTPGKLFRGEDSFRYVANNGWGLTEEVKVVVRNPFLLNSGTYEAQVLYGTAQAGTASVTLSKTGRITGTIQYEGRPLKLSGAFEGDAYQQSFALEDGEIVTVSLRLQASLNSAALISGSIHLASGVAFEIKPTARFGLPPETRAMKVTGQFRTDGDLSLPKGIGFLVGALSSRGTLVVRGRLPDNQPFSVSTRVKADGSFMFDSAPYGKGRGRLYGAFAKTYGDQGTHRWDATLKWTRAATARASDPVKIDGSVAALCATYAPARLRPAISNNGPIATGMITLNPDGELSFNETLSWSQRDVVVFTPPNLNRLQLRVSRGTGLVSGSCLNSSQELRRISGVIFAQGNGAVGLVVGEPGIGSFILYAN